MWLHFFGQVIFILILMYGLGSPLASLFPQLDCIRLGCAPLAFSLALSVLANLYVLLGIQTNWLGLIVPILFVDVAIVLFRGGQRISRCMDLRYVLLYLLVSTVVALVFYVKPLDGAASFGQGYDNYSHLATVRGYLDSGYFADGSVTTYPELWRTLTAVVASFDGGLVTVAANAVNYVLISVVLPISVLSFFLTLSLDKFAVISGSVISIAFLAFPWAFLYFGPLYPNLLGNTFLPVVLSIFILLMRSDSLESFFIHLLLFAFGCLVLLLSHPSAIFAGMVLISPYGVKEVYSRVKDSGRGGVAPFLSALAFSLLVFGVWTACYCSPLFWGTVNFNWPSDCSTSQALANVFSLALDRVSAQQLVLSSLVAIGISGCVLKRSNRWMLVSLFLACLTYVVDVSTEGLFKHYLAGFWYTDSFRIAAIVAMICIPLAAMGLSTVISLFFRAADKANRAEVVLLVLAISGVLIFSPSLPLSRSSDSDENETLPTAFGVLYSRMSRYYSLANGESTFDLEEIDFASQVKSIVGNSKVLNFPYDGSIFAYGVCGLNICNGTWGGYNSTGNMSLINSGVNRVALDSEVKKALAEENIQYLVMFDYGKSAGNDLNFTEYDSASWTGLEAVTDETEGLTLLLSKDDMRLYRIECM